MNDKKSSTTANVLDASVHQAFAVVVVAAGSGVRLGQGMPKAQVQVAGKTLLQWALEGVNSSGLASRLVVTVPESDTALTKICEQFQALAVTGGKTRSESVATALSAIERAPIREGFSDTPVRSVLIHDAARCFTPVSVFQRVSEALASGEQAVIPVLPVTDTIKAVDQQGYIESTLERASLRAVQTPQGFDLKTLLAAYQQASAQGLSDHITDDAMLAETMGIPVATVLGEADSFKITTAFDLTIAHAIKNANAPKK